MSEDLRRPTMRPGAIVGLFRSVYSAWVMERRTLLAAALAYYAFFAMAPVIFIALTVAEALPGNLVVAGWVYNSIEQILGPESAQWVQTMVATLDTPYEASSWIAFLVSAGAILWAATGLFVHMQNTLDVIWDVPLPVTRTSLAVVRQRLLAFLMVALIGVALSLAGFASVVASAVSRWLPTGAPLGLLGPLFFGALMAASLGLIYRLLPRTPIAWGDVWLGALLTAGLITFGGVALSWFLRSGITGTPFGAAGAYALVLASMYYAAQVFLIGALFTRVYAASFGSRRPAASQLHRLVER